MQSAVSETDCRFPGHALLGRAFLRLSCHLDLALHPPSTYHLLLSSILHATREPLLALRLALHFLADFDIDLEELGHAAVEANGLALVEISLAVRCVDTFRGAGLEETGNILSALRDICIRA